MHVYFGGGNAFVPQHLLDGPDVCAVLQEVRGEGMPEGMRAHPLANPGARRQVLYHGKDHGAGQPSTIPVQEYQVDEKISHSLTYHSADLYALR